MCSPRLVKYTGLPTPQNPEEPHFLKRILPQSLLTDVFQMNSIALPDTLATLGLLKRVTIIMIVLG